MLAATNEDLKVAVREGRFREDLFFRLNVFPIVIQPLRERREDIPLLIEVLLARFAQRHERMITGITPRALSDILHHDWPGNIRELENVLERGVILANEGEPIDILHLQSVEGPLGSSAWLTLAGAGDLVEQKIADSARPSTSDEATRSAVFDDIARELLRDGPASLGALETALVKVALSQAGGNISRAAPLLGLTRAQMEYRAKKLRPEPVMAEG